MATANEKVTTYRKVAEYYERSGNDTMRDRYLVLAADAALALRQTGEAEQLRTVLLARNPHHLLKPFTTFEEAMKSLDVQNYVTALRRSHPFEKAEHLLATMSGDSLSLPDDAKILPLLGPEEKRDDQPPTFVLRQTPPGPRRAVSKLNGESPPPRRNASEEAAKTAKSAGTDRALDIYRIRPDPHFAGQRSDGRAEDDESKWSPDALISSGLLLLVVLGGLSLAVYAFARPFLPRHWLP
jgi:hypothetical protein